MSWMAHLRVLRPRAALKRGFPDDAASSIERSVRRASRRRPPRRQDALLLLLALAMLFAPAFTGEDVYPHAALACRTLAMLLVTVSLWTMFGNENAVPEMFNAGLGLGFVIAAFATHCVAAHQSTSVAAGAAVIALSLRAALLSHREAPNATSSAEPGECTDAMHDAYPYTARFAAFPTAENVAAWNVASWN
jgi:hypothetical protein